MSNPIEVLRGEHQLLLHAITLAEDLQRETDDEIYHRQMHDMILFLRNYTEHFHFPKEEFILYPVLRERTENMSRTFMHEICDNHEDFKALMAEMENCFIMRDYRRLRKVTTEYLQALEKHIHTEDQVILSIAPVLLSPAEAGTIAEEFSDLDTKYLGKEQLESDLEKLNETLNRK